VVHNEMRERELICCRLNVFTLVCTRSTKISILITRYTCASGVG
jgi:hypothetical protein